MSFILNNRQIDDINNKDKEHFFSFNMKEDYSFKYIPESQFKRVVKNVQRQRRREDEERIWASFIKEQELNSPRFDEKDVHLSIQSIKGFVHENIQDVDRELKRLEEDALPERNKGVYNRKPNVRNKKSYTEGNQVRSNSPKEKTETKSKNTHDRNILIPFGQEDNLPEHEEFEESKKGFGLRPKKCLSDSSIMQKKQYTSQILRATNYFENNYDSDSSNNRNDIVHIQPNPITTHKVLSMQKKIIELLNEISFRLYRIPLPDGENDLRRRQQQTMEFGIRFSRNYIYDLNRLLINIQRHINIISSRTEHKQHHRNIILHQDIIKQKLIAAHQLLIQALNAYCKHIPNSVLEGHPTKLQDLLQLVCNFKDICNKVGISTNYFCSGDSNILSLEKDLEDKFDAILYKLKLCLESKQQPIRYKNNESAMTLASVSSNNKRHLNKKNLSGRLSMYNVDVLKNQKRKNGLNRRNYSCLKEKKCNVNTKTTCSQHYLIPELLYPSPVTHTSSSRDIIQINSTKSTNCSKEDDIKTMMDNVSIDSESEKSSAEIQNSENVKDKEGNSKIGNFTNEDKLPKTVTAITKDHLSSLVPVISNIMTLISKSQNENKAEPLTETSMETLIKFLQKCQSPKDSDTKVNLSDDSCEYLHTKLNGLSEIQKHGENVQLICMSSLDKAFKAGQCDAWCQVDYKAGAETTGNKKTKDLSIKEGIKLTISKETELQFLTYKQEYKKLCQLKPMYSSNTQNKPWDIVAWISDKLIEELIIEITKELEMTDVIKQLFKMEFQEF